MVVNRRALCKSIWTFMWWRVDIGLVLSAFRLWTVKPFVFWKWRKPTGQREDSPLLWFNFSDICQQHLRWVHDMTVRITCTEKWDSYTTETPESKGSQWSSKKKRGETSLNSLKYGYGVLQQAESVQEAKRCNAWGNVAMACRKNNATISCHHYSYTMKVLETTYQTRVKMSNTSVEWCLFHGHVLQ